ncbi:hypothetical protein [Enterococcus sp. AZ196]|uniref:hypothetical protein n=1 Tax=Enterococcus sp. AZ196 TaxID=2774659 RepID=UPI003D269A69
MTTLLEELTGLNRKKSYSIVLNGIGSFQFVTTTNLKLSNIKESHKGLLDFKLMNKKNRGKYSVLEFGGKTQLESKELVRFLLDIIGYKKKNFQPELLTVAITKKKGEKPILIVSNMMQDANGEIIIEDLKKGSKAESVAILGDYFFRTYDSFQATLQKLVDIWVNE